MLLGCFLFFFFSKYNIDYMTTHKMVKAFKKATRKKKKGILTPPKISVVVGTTGGEWKGEGVVKKNK